MDTLSGPVVKVADMDYSCHRPKAVVLGLGINGLAIVRSLAMCGVEVWGCYVEANEFGRHSRYCKAIRLPRLEDGEKDFLRELIAKVGNRESKPVLLGQSDQYVMCMSRNREELGTYFRFVLPEQELLEDLAKKDRSAKYVAGKGLRVPETYVTRKNDAVEDIVVRAKFPCVVKPVDSFSVNLGAKVRVFTDKNSLRLFLQDRPDLFGDIVVQELVPGGDSNTYQATCFRPKGASQWPIFTMRKIRQYPTGFGITSYGISESIPSLQKMVWEFLLAIDYQGFISLEFKSKASEWFFIEANARLPYYHALIRDSGINLPYMYYEDALGVKTKVDEFPRQSDGVRWIYLANDFPSALKVSPGVAGVARWLVSVLKARSFAYFDLSDMTPFFLHLQNLIGDLWKRTSANVN